MARNLLAGNQPVRAVVRDLRKGQAWAQLGCDLVHADINDAGALTSAFKGAEGVFVLVPPNFDPSLDFHEARAAAATLRSAIEGARPGRVIEGEAGPTSLRASDTVPTPTAFLSTSFGKYQILCRVDSFAFEQESTLKLFAIPLGGDLACTDCGRVLRMPGFRNCKYDPTYPVTVTYPCDSTSNLDDFRLDIPAASLATCVARVPRFPAEEHRFPALANGCEEGMGIEFALLLGHCFRSHGWVLPLMRARGRLPQHRIPPERLQHPYRQKY